MKINKLKRIPRKDLLKLLVLQSKRIDELESKLNDEENKINDKTILINNCCSIEEASLHLNKILETTEASIKKYLDNIKRISNIKEESLYEK